MESRRGLSAGRGCAVEASSAPCLPDGATTSNHPEKLGREPVRVGSHASLQPSSLATGSSPEAMTIRTELRSANPRQLERIPNFFIIGHAKCGTTALWEMLRRHPQIYMPHEKGFASKEPWFFSRENPNPQLTGERSVRFTGRHEMTLEEYLTLFVEARAGQIVGEASTSYIWSTTAATR